MKRLHAGDVAWAPDLFHDDDPALAKGGTPVVTIDADGERLIFERAKSKRGTS